MDVRIKFGLTIPIRENNLFSIEKESWLLSRVPVPEGPLEGLGNEKLVPYAKECLAILKAKFPKVTLTQRQHPRFYQFLQDGLPIFTRLNPEVKALARKLPTLRVISLDDACTYIQGNRQLWDSLDLLDFLESVQGSLSATRMDYYKARYPFIVHTLRG